MIASRRVIPPFFGAIAAILVVIGSAGSAAAQHRGPLERGPRASVTGEHGTYNIAWVTLNDLLFVGAPMHEVMVTYHTPRRGAGAVTERHWQEMLGVARDEIAARCPAPSRWEVVRSSRDYESDARAAGAELRVTYACYPPGGTR